MSEPDWQFSKHAVERALDMALDPEDIRSVLEHPKSTWTMDAYPDYLAMTDYRIILCVAADRTVVTILWYRLPKHGRFTREVEEDLTRIRDKEKDASTSEEARRPEKRRRR